MTHAIEGSGKPLVYLLPVHAELRMKAFPAIAGHQTITIEHPGSSIEESANEVVAMLEHLGIARADFLGQSYGGAVATMIALRHPKLARRVVTYGATFGPPEVAHDERMLRFDAPPTAADRAFAHFRKGREERWPAIFDKASRIRWNGFSKEELASIETPMLVLLGDRDFVRLEHVVETYRLLPNAELGVIPDAGHFALFSEPERVIPIVTHFLEKPAHRAPVATAAMGWHPGETR